MKRKATAVIISILLVSLISSIGFCDLPKGGVLPNKEVALKVAELILVQIYGEQVLGQRPFSIKAIDGYWIIDGTLHCEKGNHCLGGTAHIELNKVNGEVRQVTHGK